MNGQCTVYGMDYLYELSRSAVRRSTAPAAVKEGLAYSLNCFYRLYGGADENFSPDAKQCGLYELVYRLITPDTATAELKSMWYIYFPYVILSGAPHDEGIYEALKDELATTEIFDETLRNKYCEMIFDSDEEARVSGVDPLVIDWYAPFNEYKFSCDGNGDMRLIAALKRELALKNFDYVSRFSERLMNMFPHSGTLILLYLAAVTGSLEGKPQAERESIVNDLLAFIEAVKDVPADIDAQLLYYRGLCFIALKRPDDALDAFAACLDSKPGYESAELMIRAIHKMRDGE